NEFCYKFNRRYFGEDCFERLMIACVKTNPNFRTVNG
ncbi:MAG: IS1595 family transposase, partial [Prevotellaceae bacterium]|nr:IS1595 family transposase [Prevotellaceae bacterium]MDR1985034.1 IS1595 family transposase [Prevotellaceae bacterium]MDR1985062.1 IS1595 family transposase [Prevotellaceae bacterium]